MAVLLAKFREDQYERLLRVFEDRVNLPNSYALWLKIFQHRMQDLTRRGAAVYPIDVDLDELIGWCEAEGDEVNNDSLLNYVDYVFVRTQNLYTPPHRISASDFLNEPPVEDEDSDYEN